MHQWIKSNSPALGQEDSTYLWNPISPQVSTMTWTTLLVLSWFFSIANTYKSTWVCLYAESHQVSPKSNIKRVEKKSAKDKQFHWWIQGLYLSPSPFYTHAVCRKNGRKKKKKTRRGSFELCPSWAFHYKIWGWGREGRVMMEALASPLFKYQYLF